MGLDSVNVVITYQALPGMADLAREELAALIETVVAEEPACHGIQLFQGSGDPHCLLLTEQWDSEEAYRGPHMQTAHLTAFRARAAKFLAGPPEITCWHAVTEVEPESHPERSEGSARRVSASGGADPSLRSG